MALLKIIILQIIDLIILVLNMNIKAYAFINFQNIKGHECNKSSLLKHVKKDNELSVCHLKFSWEEICIDMFNK